jgi:hypothetical protein
MKLLDELPQIIGKRVVSAIEYDTEDLNDGVFLVFEDDTAICLVAERGYYSDAVHLSTSTQPMAPHYLHEAGVISAEELQELEEMKRLRNIRAQEISDRNLYLELKQRFEP